MSTCSYLVSCPVEAHQAVNELFQSQIKPQTSRGARGRIIWQPVNERRRHQLRKMFHGPVLRDIAFQVWVLSPQGDCRVRFIPKAWKQYFAELFVEPTFEEYTVRRTGEVKVRERRRSTEELSDDEFAEFLLQVLAHAVCEWSVTFTEQDDNQ